MTMIITEEEMEKEEKEIMMTEDQDPIIKLLGKEDNQADKTEAKNTENTNLHQFSLETQDTKLILKPFKKFSPLAEKSLKLELFLIEKPEKAKDSPSLTLPVPKLPKKPSNILEMKSTEEKLELIYLKPEPITTITTEEEEKENTKTEMEKDHKEKKEIE